MDIGQEIQQKSFRNEYQKAMINLIYTSNWMQERIKQLIEEEEITIQQYNILRILRGSKTPLSTQKIRERMVDKMSDTSRIVDRLLKKGLVDKKISAADKRLVDVTITEIGLILLAKIDLQNNEMDKIISNLSVKEAEILNNLLDKLRDKL